MPWEYINRLLGPGLHWGRTQQELLAAIDRARADREFAAAEHIELILEMRNRVCVERPLKKETPEA